MERAFVLDGVSKRFGRGPWVLHHASLTVAPSSVIMVTGANGTGKSTLLRIATGLSRPTTGQIRNRPAAISFAPENPAAQIRLTAGEYLNHMARLRHLPVAEATSRAAELFHRLGLAPGPDMPVRLLSKGNAQKVTLTQAFLAPVDLVMLDEPFAGLDDIARAVTWELIDERRAAGGAVLLTGHTPGPDPRADRTVELRQGEVVAAGAVEGVIRVELVAPSAARGWLEDLPGVRVEAADGKVTVRVGRSDADALLAQALSQGCSVLAVNAE
ncbi:MAG TPA: ABC transporter ATP-binding protein [Acidimicrobiales bacterium]|jgi:ABC-type multidrug transport system ATPase subunit|nr:ABC transporter ATP-binding protein [Acidimicrobiales bacterium]